MREAKGGARLTDPLDVKGLHLRSRLVMAPMVTGLALDHAPTEAQLEWYRTRARTGLGLVIVEATAVAEDGQLTPRSLGLWEDAQTGPMARLAKVFREEGVPAVVQLVHGGARAFREDLRAERISPSGVAVAPGPAPRAMTEAEIEALIRAFAASARRVREAGFDGVELHAAHTYLLSQFLSPRTNTRTDAWGGDRVRRTRLVLEVVRAVREAVGEAFPILVRMHAVERVEGGMDAADILHAARALEAAGCDLLDASGIGSSSLGDWEGQPFLQTSSVSPRGVRAGEFAPHAALLRQALSIPVIAVGRLGEEGLAARVLAEGQADLVALGRQLIADPQSARLILEGRESEIERCRECFACFGAIRRGPVRCSVHDEPHPG